MPHRPPNPVRRLSEALRPIYELECRLGNPLVAVDEPGTTAGLVAVTLRDPLHFDEIERSLSLPPTVVRWESRDPHYPLEAGYVCKRSNHSIAGPLAK